MFTLERFLDHSKSPAIGCIGQLYDPDHKFLCYTIERPWLDNKPFFSCIPVGKYKLEEINTPKHGDTLVMVNHDLGVYAAKFEAGQKDRYTCLIHSANWSHQVQGCIGLGSDISYGQDKKNPPALMITNSKNTVRKFLPIIAGELLNIRWKNT